jgi:hypothetical protein
LNVLFRKFEIQTPGTPSLDQLLVLLTVVEEGSFTGAAKRLRRAPSAISYAIDTLEAQLGLALFDRGTTRKPKLTHVGEAIVSEAKAVAHSGRVGRNAGTDGSCRHRIRKARAIGPSWLARGEFPMQVVHKIETPPGPAGRWLIEQFLVSSSAAEAHIVPEVAKPTNIKKHHQPPRRDGRAF